MGRLHRRHAIAAVASLVFYVPIYAALSRGSLFNAPGRQKLALSISTSSATQHAKSNDEISDYGISRWYPHRHRALASQEAADLDRKVMRLARNNAQARRFIEFSSGLDY
jgi:hypothetical protein